jgi:hypothetical protein
MTVAPWRILTRPVSIPNPIAAIAITAIDVAAVPSSTSCSQDIAATSTLDPAGESASEIGA